ncbi:MAG: HlyD family efflux transporter periplasmic adaptor subunit [Betaproteobacteria bacterium]|nr:HlyD family efflux transporter periplasmic adaptor subunit [Betaproteobacteria bacterium]
MRSGSLRHLDRCQSAGEGAAGRPPRGLSRLAGVFAAALLCACSPPPAASWQGYAEGEYLLLAVPVAGILERLDVARGQQVVAGAPLFALERANEQAAVAEARARLDGAAARLANLQSGRRALEVEAVQAQVRSAQAALDLSREQLAQQERLRAGGFVSAARLDEARAAHARDTARLAEARAQAGSARQNIGRDAEIRAARADAQAASQAMEQARWRLGQKSVAAPALDDGGAEGKGAAPGALVADTFYNRGEWVPAGSPVVSLLPPGNIKLRFFVPEGALGSLRTGQSVTASCDGCGASIPATIRYISPQAEYSPPVIYSKESRAKLVFLVEAKPKPEDASRLKPGQPVDVALSATPATREPGKP